MFKNLKEKLKGWIKKTDEEAEEVAEGREEDIKKPNKKEKKPEKKSKDKKEKEKEKTEKAKEKKKKEKPKEEPEEEKSPKKRISLFKSKKEQKDDDGKPEEAEEVAEKIESEEKEVEEKYEPETEEAIKKPKKTLFKKSLSEEKFEELFDELELILLQNNVAYEAVESLRSSLKEKLVGESAKADITEALKESINELLQNPPSIIEQIKEKNDGPFVILFTGINGSGKTTSIAKLANLLKKNNFSLCLASADTFRAAAIEQLQVHADRLDIPLIKKDYGADPASVGFDAVKYAEKNDIDVVLIDTAGRMNNRDSLMKEIEKIARVNSPDLKIFLGESITGNDATTQAKDFNDAVGIDGIILSKADVDEKGGTAISVSHVTGKPIYFLGTGQTYDDLEVFDKDKLIEQMF